MYPFERFSENAKQVLTLAQSAAQEAGHSYIGTEHMLLGLMREQHGLAALALGNMGLQIDEVKSAIDSMLQDAGVPPGLKQIIPTPRVKRVIEMSFEEARLENMNQVETGHLLIGLVQEGDGIASHVLVDRGVTVERLRDQLAALRGAGRVESIGGTGRPTPRRVHLAFTDEDGKPIAVDILLPADYPKERQDALLNRLKRAVEGGKAPPGA